MTLSRSTPLRSSKEHDVELTDTSGTWGHYRCTRCGDSRSELIPKVESGERDPLPWPCTGLKRTRLQRNKRVNPVSDRRDEKRSHQRHEAFRGFVRRQPCVVCGDRPSDAAHVRSWGAGHGDADNLVSLCRRHHSEQHAVGIETFQERHDVDLEAKAAEMGERFRAHLQQEGTDGAV